MSLELFPDERPQPPAREEPHVYRVSELTRGLRALLEEHVGTVWVEGEISNYRKQPSGHQYFTLKDESSQLACVWFARAGAWRKSIPLSDGMCVQVRGAMTVYEARGQYQLNVQLVQAAGAGLLQARFEALKRKLEAEGLFDPDRKRPLPSFPRAIGLITSPTGAAVRDMLNVLSRRAPWLRVVIMPVRVQGDGAAEEIAAAIEKMCAYTEAGHLPLDLLVLARGGGSVEDLWAFNEEVLARAIAASTLPVVSAVGHEIDFTIADFTADLRAPTPSAAAELIAPSTEELLRRVSTASTQLTRCLHNTVGQARQRLISLSRTGIFREPLRRLQEATQRLDLATEQLHRGLHLVAERKHRHLAELALSLRQHRPDQLLALHRQRLRHVAERLHSSTRARLQAMREHLDRQRNHLELLSPASTLQRGYTITTNSEGQVIRAARELKPGSRLVTTFADGKAVSVVTEKPE